MDITLNNTGIILRMASRKWSTRNNPRLFMSTTTAGEDRTTVMQQNVFFGDYAQRVCAAVCLTVKLLAFSF